MERKKKKETGLISVIVPVYNVERYIRKCLDSIRSQSYKNLEIILVDDGSTDKSSIICDLYKELDERVVVIHKENGGLSSARNAGLKKAKGDLIGFVDGDDYIDVTMYEKLKENMDKYKSDIAVCSFYKSYKYLTDLVEGTDTEAVYQGKEKFANLENENDLLTTVPCNKLYKKTIFKSISYPEGKLFEDSYIITDILTKAKKVSYLNEPLYYYTMRKSAISSKYNEQHVEMLDSIDKNITCFTKHKYSDLAIKEKYKKIIEVFNYSNKIKAKKLQDEKVSKYVDDALKLGETIKDNKYLSEQEKNTINLILKNKDKYYKNNKKVWRFKRLHKNLMSYK